MPRGNRADKAGAIYHALNRGNARQTIFHKDGDYAAFLNTLHEGLQRYEVDLFCFTVMPNHWHLVLRPRRDGQMGCLLRWVTATHAQRYHAHYHTAGEGHLYQGPYKSFPVQDDEHFLVVCRYVERNPLRAGLVSHAEKWRYSSLWHWIQETAEPKLLTSWPILRPPHWLKRVNQPLTANELAAVRCSVQRGRPFGDDSWTEKIADQQNLWPTLRPQGRPRRRIAGMKKTTSHLDERK